MFEAAVSGSRTEEIEGVEVVVRPALTAAAVDLMEADGYLLGTPMQLTLSTLARQQTVLSGRRRRGARGQNHDGRLRVV